MPVIEQPNYEEQIAEFRAANPDVTDPDDAYKMLYPHPEQHLFRHIWFRLDATNETTQATPQPEPAPEPVTA